MWLHRVVRYYTVESFMNHKGPSVCRGHMHLKFPSRGGRWSGSDAADTNERHRSTPPRDHGRKMPLLLDAEHDALRTTRCLQGGTNAYLLAMVGRA